MSNISGQTHHSAILDVHQLTTMLLISVPYSGLPSGNEVHNYLVQGDDP